VELNSSGLLVQLDGGISSDPDNDPLNYQWILSAPDGSSAVLDNPNSVSPSFTADVVGTYTAQLQVYDGNLYSDMDAVTITVAQANLPPVSDAGPDQSLDISSGSLLVQLNGSGSSDPEGQQLSYYWALYAPVGSQAILNDYMLPNPNFTADVAGVYTVYLWVSDGYNYSEDTVMQAPTSSCNWDKILYWSSLTVADQTILTTIH